MTENKLYAQCREEAIKQIEQKCSPSKAPIVTLLCKDEINQLTAEIYGMKLLDMVSPLDMNKDYYLRGEWEEWFKSNYADMNKHDTIGSTQDLHDMFVREFNKENS